MLKSYGRSQKVLIPGIRERNRQSKGGIPITSPVPRHQGHGTFFPPIFKVTITVTGYTLFHFLPSIARMIHPTIFKKFVNVKTKREKTNRLLLD